MTPMPFAPQLSVWLLQAAAFPDTIVAKTMPAERSLFDYTSGTLQLVVLVLAVVVLGAMVFMLIALKRGLDSLKTTVEKFYVDARPIIAQASHVAGDAREVVAMLKTDVERVTHAAGAISDQLLDVADAAERRMDDIRAVLDVVQGELEETVLSTTATLRGVRMGGRAVASALRKSGRAKSRRDEYESRETTREAPRLRDRQSRHQRNAGD
jgi:hypothetical protein